MKFTVGREHEADLHVPVINDFWLAWEDVQIPADQREQPGSPPGSAEERCLH